MYSSEEMDDLERQLAEAQRWSPVEDGDGERRQNLYEYIENQRAHHQMQKEKNRYGGYHSGMEDACQQVMKQLVADATYRIADLLARGEFGCVRTVDFFVPASAIDEELLLIKIAERYSYVTGCDYRAWHQPVRDLFTAWQQCVYDRRYTPAQED